MQYTYWPISHEGKATRQLNLSVNRISQNKYFLQHHAENEAGRLSRELVLFFNKALSEVKAAGFQYIWIAFNLAYNKNKLYKTLDQTLNFPSHCFSTTMIFQQKCFSCYILLTESFIVYLPLLLKILGNMCITITC